MIAVAVMPVGVRIADHKNQLAACNRLLQPYNRPLHIGQQERVVKQPVVLIQKQLCLFSSIQAATDQNLRNDFIDAATGRYAVYLFFRARTFQHPAL